MPDEKPKRQTRYETLPFPLRVYFIVATLIGILLSIYFIFGIIIKGFTFYDAQYYFLLFGLFGSCIFLIAPERKKLKWYDLVLSAAILVLNIYFATKGEQIALVGWAPASTPNIVLAVILFLLIIEGARRASGGWAWPLLAVFFASYPLFADHFPGIFMGVPNDFTHTVLYMPSEGTVYSGYRDGSWGAS